MTELFKPLAKALKEDKNVVEKKAFFEELCALNVCSSREAEKVAEEVTKTEAQVALRRLKKLEKKKPSLGELGRGAAAGAVVGPVAATASRMVSGGWRRGVIKNIRDVAAPAASGAVFGSLLPTARHHLERESEKEKLRDFIEQSPRSKLRRKLKKTLGV